MSILFFSRSILLLCVPYNNKEVNYIYCDNFLNKIFINKLTEIISYLKIFN